MSTAHSLAKSYFEQLQDFADDYFDETGQETATTKEIAEWAINTGRWLPPAGLVLQKCREDFSKALRAQHIATDDGTPVRAKHVARIVRHGEQTHLWADIRNAKREHMSRAFQQRREQIVGDCRQLKRDVDYFNTARPAERSIQVYFDFRDDVHEDTFSGHFEPTSVKPR